MRKQSVRFSRHYSLIGRQYIWISTWMRSIELSNERSRREESWKLAIR
jgi:hypothetical protein